MKNLSNEILAKIEREHIKPLPGWFFQARNILAWVLAVIVIIFASAILGLIAHIIINQDWSVHQENNLSITANLLGTLPYNWFFCLLIALVVTYFIIKGSKTGYKYSSIIIITISLSISLLIGTIIFETGIGRLIDNSLANNFPTYNSSEDQKIYSWQKPELGYLGGKIIDADETEIKVLDFNGKIWIVDVSKISTSSQIKEPKDKKVKILGTETGENIFQATAIYSWNSCGRLVTASACQ